MSSPVALNARLLALSGKLRSQMAADLLDLPLDALELPGLELAARELLLGCFEAGVASTLRELLADDRLARWAEQSCTEREQDELCAAFGRMLGAGSTGPDDPARLVQLAAPELTPSGLRSWARQHGLSAELNRPARELLDGLVVGHNQTLADCCLQTSPPDSRSLLDAPRTADAALAYLFLEARSQAALPAREALWQTPRPAGALRVLCERLSALLVGVTASALHTLRFVPARPVTLDEQSGVASGQLRGTDKSSVVEVKLYLLGFEQRALASECSACRSKPCLHVQALAGRLLDGCLRPNDSLRARLETFVSVPSWKRFFSALGPTSQGESAQTDRLCFALRMSGETGSVGVLGQTLASDGGYSAGKLLSPQRALTRAGCRDEDRSVLDALLAKSRTLAGGYLPLDLAVLRGLAEHPRVLIDGERGFLRVTEQALEVKLLEQPDGLLPEVLLDGNKVRFGTRASSASYLLHLDRGAQQLSFAALTPSLARLLAALENFRGVLPKESFPLLAPYMASLQKVARVDTPKALLGLEQPAPRRLLLRLSPSFDEGIELTLAVRPLALSGLWPPGAGPELVHGLSEGQQIHTRRDLAWEKDAAEQAIDLLSLRRAQFVEPFRYFVETTQDALALLSRAARLSYLIDIEWAEHSGKLSLNNTITQGDLKVGLFKRGAFFLPEGGARTAGTTVALGQLLDAARRNERFVRVAGDDYAEIEEDLFERLSRAQLCIMDLKLKLQLPVEAARFWLSALGDVTQGEDIESTRLLEAAGSLALAPPALPPELNEQLRDYQRAGVAFMQQRASWAPGVCLADEMGLGKTIQAVAMLAERGALGPAMVVSPTSLVDNWRSELERFAPQLRPLTYRGAERDKLLGKLTANSVLLISYELLLRDREHFSGLHFVTQVIDEAQVIKNARTLRARAVSSLPADFRIALSGTPLENRLGDLWSLFHLLAPGLLGSWPRFRARFAVPIERYDNQERMRDLRALIAPFMLRRTKDDVMKELPARTEVIHMVELSTAEQNLYRSAVERARAAVGKRSWHDPARSVHILAELTRLRQLACHPRLVLEDERVESSKLAALTTLLKDILPRGHRVLVFSQFTAHLALIREALDTLQIASLSLEGSTPAGERSRLVAEFQTGSTPVFLISLKAGGTGLNLTAADYVVHMDPWWNPSAEDQASDRTHRIGQQRPVTIVKLVAQDTIEERVLSLHAHKRRLADAVLGQGDDSSLVPELSELLDSL